MPSAVRVTIGQLDASPNSDLPRGLRHDYPKLRRRTSRQKFSKSLARDLVQLSISHATARPERYCSSSATVTTRYPNEQLQAPTPMNHCQR